MSSTTDAAPTTDPDPKPASEMSDIERIKAAHAARRSRRSRPPRSPSTSIISAPAGTDSSDAADAEQQGENADGDAVPGSGTDSKKEDDEVTQLRQEVSSLKLELSSLRRNHLENLKRVTEQRDMFATQLSKEQQQTQAGTAHRSKSLDSNDSATTNEVADLKAQLRAARVRNSDLETENVMLRDSNKQLSFRVQAAKTLDAASTGYQTVVDDLVDAKLKSAQLAEEKEDLLRINKELTTTSQVLRDANGELEKSRSQWVLQCAEVEKKRTALEALLKEKNATTSNGTSGSSAGTSTASFNTTDLQELKL